MMVSVVNKHSAYWHQIIKDLSPYPGRWAQAWRTGLICAIVTLISMKYQIPAAVLSCYVVLFVMKSDAAESMVMGGGLIVLVSLVVFLLIFLIQLTIESPPAWLAVIIVVSFIFLFLGAASALGDIGGIIALVLAFVMTLVPYAPIGEVATRVVLYAWLVILSPMAILIIANLLVGRRPKTVLTDEIVDRFELAAHYLLQQASKQEVYDNLALGLSAQTKRLQWLSLFHLAPKDTRTWLESSVVQSYRVLAMFITFTPQAVTATHNELAEACLATAARIRKGLAPEPFTFTATYPEGSPEAEIKATLVALADLQNPSKLHPEKTAFFLPDAFTNPIYQLIAIKTTGAAVFCYFIYTSLDWAGVHTAMITCYVAAINTTGETVNKLILRITGCLVGVILATILLAVFMPHMSSVGWLMLAVFLVCSLAAWVFVGPERVAYAGAQIAFAFLLISLQGFGPDVDLTDAHDRIIGILIGNTVMFFVFTYIWPLSVMVLVKKHIVSITEKLQSLPQLNQKDAIAAMQCAADVSQEFADMDYKFSLAKLEGGQIKHSPQELSSTHDTIEQLRKSFYSIGIVNTTPMPQT